LKKNPDPKGAQKIRKPFMIGVKRRSLKRSLGKTRKQSKAHAVELEIQGRTGRSETFTSTQKITQGTLGREPRRTTADFMEICDFECAEGKNLKG